MHQLICPACNGVITVSPAAPAQLMCPNCRTRLINPFAGQSPAPLPVIPIEQEVKSDQTRTYIILIALVVLLLAGACVSVATLGTSNALFHLLIVPLIVALIAAAAIDSQRRARRALDDAHAKGTLPAERPPYSFDYDPAHGAGAGPTFTLGTGAAGCVVRTVLAIVLFVGFIGLLILGLCGAIIFSSSWR